MPLFFAQNNPAWLPVMDKSENEANYLCWDRSLLPSSGSTSKNHARSRQRCQDTKCIPWLNISSEGKSGSQLLLYCAQKHLVSYPKNGEREEDKEAASFILLPQ